MSAAPEWITEARTRLDECRRWNGDRSDIDQFCDTAGRALDALDAVLALHAPTDDQSGTWCSVCMDYNHDGFEAWPCPTVRAITGEDG